MTNRSLPVDLPVCERQNSTASHLSSNTAPIRDGLSTGTEESPYTHSSSASGSQQHVKRRSSRGSEEIHVEGHDENSTLLPTEPRRQPSEYAEPQLRPSRPHSDTEKAKDNSSVLLHRSGYTVFMVAIYSSLALTAWTLTCLLTHNPLTVKQYEVNFDDRSFGFSAKHLHSRYVKSEEVYRAARTLQTVVAVLTIPLTSAVCSAATVVFAQAGSKQRRLTMRQLMVLADKGWTDPATILKVVFGERRRYGSRLLFLAVLINILGASITPLQTILVTPKVIKTPTSSTSVMFLADIPDQFKESWDENLVTVMTRNALSTSNTAPQARLWQNDFNCSSLDGNITEQCLLGAATLGQISELSNSYFAQLPAGFHTGVIKQFLPRMNSSVQWEPIPVEAMPVGCGALPDSYYIHYSNSTWPPQSDWRLIGGAPKNWSIEACMPGNQSVPPWSDTYDRQDFTEELYLNISVMGYDWLEAWGEPQGSPYYGGLFKVTSNTTAGYFELPNHMNGGKAGLLIDTDPFSLCGSDCMSQASAKRVTPRAAPINYQSGGSWKLNSVKNKGPLLTVAMALFGYESYIPTRLSHPEAFLTNMTSNANKPGYQANYATSCIGQRPMGSLLEPSFGTDSNCIMDTARTPADLDDQIAHYLQSFYVNTMFQVGDTVRPTNAFAAAVYLATEAWFTTGHTDWGSRTVYFDAGADTTIPSMSLAAMIVVSSLLGIYLACLIVLSLYSARKPRWTSQLDAFAMMRIGAEMHEIVPLKIGFDVGAIRALDETPGFVGDATGGEGEIGTLGIGSSTPLNGVRCYKSYEADAAEQARKKARKIALEERSKRIDGQK